MTITKFSRKQKKEETCFDYKAQTIQSPQIKSSGLLWLHMRILQSLKRVQCLPCLKVICKATSDIFIIAVKTFTNFFFFFKSSVIKAQIQGLTLNRGRSDNTFQLPENLYTWILSQGHYLVFRAGLKKDGKSGLHFYKRFYSSKRKIFLTNKNYTFSNFPKEGAEELVLR